MMQPAFSARGEENISTPAEAARLMEMLYKGEFINASVCNEIIGILKKGGKEASQISKGIPQDVDIAYKPGGLPGVATEWAIVYLKEQPYVFTIMENYAIQGVSDQTIEKLSKVLYDYFWRRANASPYGTYVDPVLLKNNSPKKQ
jgi:beta-lactamase class A